MRVPLIWDNHRPRIRLAPPLDRIYSIHQNRNLLPSALRLWTKCQTFSTRWLSIHFRDTWRLTDRDIVALSQRSHAGYLHSLIAQDGGGSPPLPRGGTVCIEYLADSQQLQEQEISFKSLLSSIKALKSTSDQSQVLVRSRPGLVLPCPARHDLPLGQPLSGQGPPSTGWQPFSNRRDCIWNPTSIANTPTCHQQSGFDYFLIIPSHNWEIKVFYS